MRLANSLIDPIPNDRRHCQGTPEHKFPKHKEKRSYYRHYRHTSL